MSDTEQIVYQYLQRYLTAVWDTKYVCSIRGSLTTSSILREIDDAGLTDHHVRAVERMTHARLHTDAYDSYANFNDALKAADDRTGAYEGDSTFVAFIDTNLPTYRRYIVLNMGVWYE